MIAIPLSAIFYFPTSISSGFENLSEAMSAITWSSTDQFGFESCDITRQGDLEDVMFWFGQLGGELAVYSPDADECWRGFLNAVDAKIGQETHSRSLDGMANRIRVRYTATLGTPYVTSAATNAASIARYGTKDYVERLGDLTKTPAETMRDNLLKEMAWPRKRPTSEVRTGAMGGIEITLHFVGWYGALDWLLTSQPLRTNAVTTTQVTGLITSYNSTNNIFSTNFVDVLASGLSETQFIPPDTTVRAAIERLLLLGNASGVRQVWGVNEEKRFSVSLWAGNSPTTITYRRSLGGAIEYAGGGSVPLWLVRPNAMYEITELLDVVPNTDEVDSAARYYVARTTFQADANGMSVQLEPTDSSNITAQLAQLNRGN